MGDGIEEISKCQKEMFPEFRDKEDRRKGLIMEWRGESTLNATVQPRQKS